MKHVDYKEAVKVTLAELGSKINNNNHMVMGMAGELGEIIQAVNKKDLVNVGEELTDVAWFGTEWQNINELVSAYGIFNIEDKFVTPVDFGYRIVNKIYKALLWSVNRSSPLRYPELYKLEFEKLVIIVSEIVDLEKREFAYKKPQLDTERVNLLRQLYYALSWCYYFAGINAEDSLQKNIDKLMVRYHKKRFEAEQANNRNLASERKVLEG